MISFTQKTNWCVITGAPSSGKTSVIDVLRARGYAVEHEVARELIEQLLRDGRKLGDIRNSPEETRALQHRILEVKTVREKALTPENLIFMDRGMGDSITYFRLAGLDVTEAIASASVYQYRKIFIFDRLPLKRDNIRTESDSDAETIDKMLEEDYKMLGYNPVRVRVMPIEMRADFILKSVEE